MTTYVAAYDVENPECLAGVRRILRKHEQYEMPATFFIVAGTFEQDRQEYLALLADNPLFEIASHSYTHMVLADTPEFGTAGPQEQFPREIVESKRALEDAFQCAVSGFRTPVGTLNGLGDAPHALRLVNEAGYTYVSSLAWGKGWSLPAPPRQPFTYADHGYPHIWEIPPCGWHENLLKGNNECGPVRLLLFPPELDVPIPRDYVETPAEEFGLNNEPFIDLAVARGMPVVSLVWHPWSLNRFDPEMQMLDLTFQYVREKGLPCATFAQVAEELTEGAEGSDS